MYLDNTEIGKKYKNQKGKVVTVIDIVTKNINFTVARHGFPREVNLVLYRLGENLLVDEQETFEMLHAEIEPVYEYQFAVKINCFSDESDEGFTWDMAQKYYTIEESHKVFNAEYKILEFTKRERKCI